MEKQAEPVKFSNQEVADKFESTTTDDMLVHKAGVYSGQFSAISPKMAEAMVKQKSNLIKKKEAPKAELKKDEKPK